MRYDLLLSFSTLFTLAAAHSMHQRRAPTPEDLVREEIRAREHAIMATNCEQEIREHVAMRMARRAELQRREARAMGNSIHVPRAHYSTIQNTTCVTAPEVTEGPYYVNNELVRGDITESQQGVKLLMDFGVMDTSTCTPMNNTFVEIWHANALGLYGAYSTSTVNRLETWLRGGWYTDANGIVEISTIYPGYYTGRAPHIHIMVHKDWTQSANGTLVSHAGTVVHIGQAFFPENWNDQVYRTAPYPSNTNRRTLNSQDQFLGEASANGYSAYTDLQFLSGSDMSGGLVGYLTLGVNSRSSYTINNKNYNTGTGGITSGNSNGNSNTSGGGSTVSAASMQARGWENTLYLSFFMFIFFAYRHTPNVIRY